MTQRLTPRERQIVELIAQGASNKRIATTLGTSVRTVKNQMTTLFEKCGVASRLELAVWAMKQRANRRD